MKIAIWHNMPSGGGKRALYDHVRGLAALGHETTVWCPQTADREFLPITHWATENIVPLKISTANEVQPGWRGWVAKFNHERIPARLKAMAAHCVACATEINSKVFDGLFANSCQFFRTTPIAKYVNLPSVLFLQEPYRWLYEAMPNPPWAALPEKPIWKWRKEDGIAFAKDWVKVRWWRVQIREEVSNGQAFDKVLVNSYYSRESVLRAYGLDSTVCYLSVDTDLFVPKGLNREKFVMGIGAIVPEKNIHFIIESLGKLTSPPPLLWVGNVTNLTYLRQLNRLAETLGVTFTTKVRIPDAEVINLLNRASIFIYAPRLEPFGYAPLEANACGTPVVAVAEGGVRETVHHLENGLLVPHDHLAMAEAVQRLLDQPDLAQKLGQQGRGYVVREWSFDAGIKRLEDQLLKVFST